MIRANSSDAGLNLGHDNVNMTYLYGLGDFFSVMFEDTAVTNLLLETSTLAASEVYSRFLQLTSSLSLQDIQTSIGSQIQLVLLNSTDLVSGTTTEYKLPESFTSARYVANRPLVPTELLENDVDYGIVQNEDGSCSIRFAQPLDNYALSSRLLSDTTTKQYALWFVDAHLDERLVSDYFGDLIGLDPENSSEKFANFVYGLYYVYIQGPALSTLRKGLNLVLGIPLARMSETVIDIRTYLQTDQYIVITDQNQYLIPFGLAPSVAIGDDLKIGDEIASWIEVKDYEHDGDWWLNLYIPSNIVPTTPPGQNTRYATEGSELDYVMRNYLKTHTFLVNVNVTTFKNNQQFTQLFDIIRKAKPAYTQPIYVWSVKNDETVPVDDSLTFGINGIQEEDIGGAYRYMRRNNSTTPLLRGKSRYIRFNAPKAVANALGEDDYLNSSNNNIQARTITGYANTVSLRRPNTREESEWMRILANRNSDAWHRRRNQIAFRRGRNVVDSDMSSIVEIPVSNVNSSSINSAPELNQGHCNRHTLLCNLFEGIPKEARVVPLTIITQEEVEQKCALFGIDAPVKDHSHFFLKGRVPSDEINEWVIDGAQPAGPRIDELYPDLFRREAVLAPNSLINAQMMRQFMPNREDLTDSDFLVGFRITCDLISLCLVSHNARLMSPSFLAIQDDMDDMELTIDSPPMRGFASHSTPFYMGRGSVTLLPGDGEVTPPLANTTAELLAFLQSAGVATNTKLVPMTVISLAEFEHKCDVWNVTPPQDYDRYFVISGNVSKHAINNYALNSKGSAWASVPLVGSKLNPVTGLVENEYNLYPDFYRRDSEVPDYNGITRHVLYEYQPDPLELNGADMIMGFRADRDTIALYWISNGGISSATDYWQIQYGAAEPLLRIYSGLVEQQGLVVVPPYKTVEALGYNTYDQSVNDAMINANLNLDQAEFTYQDTYNANMPVTRGGMTLRHRFSY